MLPALLLAAGPAARAIAASTAPAERVRLDCRLYRAVDDSETQADRVSWFNIPSSDSWSSGRLRTRAHFFVVLRLRAQVGKVRKRGGA
jgi:hypothetical protein